MRSSAFPRAWSGPTRPRTSRRTCSSRCCATRSGSIARGTLWTFLLADRQEPRLETVAGRASLGRARRRRDSAGAAALRRHLQRYGRVRRGGSPHTVAAPARSRHPGRVRRSSWPSTSSCRSRRSRAPPTRTSARWETRLGTSRRQDGRVGSSRRAQLPGDFAGKVLWLYVPYQGRFLLSLRPHASSASNGAAS